MVGARKGRSRTVRILIAIGYFRCLTGSEMYVYELSRELVRVGHCVTIVSNIGGEITERVKKAGAEAYGFEELPHGLTFDVMHLNQAGPSEYAIERFPKVPALATIHSEYTEAPFIDNRIRKYICIRPSVQEKLIHDYGIEIGRAEVIYNGFDFNRFNTRYTPVKREKKLVVFPGTVDRLRRSAGMDLIDRSKEEDFEVWFIGDRHADYLDNLPPTVTYMPSVWNVEDYVKQSDETAGILLGRTTIEGWLCGKPGWIYDIDHGGNIRSVTFHAPPPDREKYDIRNVVGKMLEQYAGIM